MKPGLQIITSDCKRIGYMWPQTKTDVLRVIRSPYTIPWGWVARIDDDVILRRTYAEVVAEWGAEPGPVVIAGGKE
jgi:hypothetical protein